MARIGAPKASRHPIDVAKRYIGVTVSSTRRSPFARSGSFAGFTPLPEGTDVNSDQNLWALCSALGCQSTPGSCAFGRLPDGRTAAVVRRNGFYLCAVLAKKWREANRRIRVRDTGRPIIVLGGVEPLPDDVVLAAMRRMLRGLDWDQLVSPGEESPADDE